MTNLMAAIIYFILLAIVSLTIFFAFVKDRNKLVTKHLIRLCLIAVGWQMLSALFFLINDESIALWVFDAKLIFVAFAPVQLLLVSVRFYSAKSSRKVTLFFGLLCIIPAITAALAVAAPFHNFLRLELSFDQVTPLHVLTNVRGPWFWVHSVYSYLLMISSIFYILYQHAKLPKGFRVPSVLVAIGSAIALFSNIFVVFTPYSRNIDLTLVGLSIALVFAYAAIAISDESSLLVQAFDNIFSYLEDYIFILNEKRSIIEMNPAARNWLHPLQIDKKNMCFDDLFEKLAIDSKDIISANDTGERDFYLMIDGQVSHLNLNERPILDQSGKKIGAFAIITDITRYKHIIERIEQAAEVDTLTSLGNRRSYEQAINNLDKPFSLPFSVILGDVNGLKFVNDNMGHATGDDLLRTIAQVLSNACPSGAHAYRIGGDEFVLLLPGTSTADAETIVLDIREKLVPINRQSPYNVSIALGIATKETKNQDLLQCIAQADSIMYQNKQNDRRTKRE